MKVLRFVFVCFLAVLVVGCTYYGCSYRVKYERVVELSETMESGASFSAQTFNGAITVTENQADGCEMTATITARSASVEAAQLLAEATSVKLERTPEGLKTVIERPTKNNRESISVSLDVKVPGKTALSLSTSNGRIGVTSILNDVTASTSNGSIDIANVKGRVTAKTSNGRIEIHQTNAGKFELHTSNGKIFCEAVTGDIQASTSNGAIHVKYGPNAAPATNINLHTSNGSITVDTPKNYSAKVDASTSNSKIYSNVPIMVQGAFGKHVQGTIGSGEGQMTLKTSNGSITIN